MECLPSELCEMVLLAASPQARASLACTCTRLYDIWYCLPEPLPSFLDKLVAILDDHFFPAKKQRGKRAGGGLALHLHGPARKTVLSVQLHPGARAPAYGIDEVQRGGVMHALARGDARFLDIVKRYKASLTGATVLYDEGTQPQACKLLRRLSSCSKNSATWSTRCIPFYQLA